MSTSSATSTPPSTAASLGVPRVGGVRCYWSLIRPKPSVAGQPAQFELEFVHPDPVLAVHLASQRLSLMGRGVLEFIHPAERERARSDLSNAISLDDLQGSVTRVRFARLSWIRRLLGCKPEELEVPYDASTFTEDDEYLILDLVINWVADGLLLAFFHAIRDKDPAANNDPSKQHEEWTNYCGTAKMGEDQIEALHASISNKIALPPLTRFPPQRVFQIHTSQESPVRPGQLIFSWPPARPIGVKSPHDGRYDAEEYAKLMDGVAITGRRYASGETHTNCTTRFGATHSITSEGAYRHVSSVFIPYGTLIFAAFQTTKQVELQPRTTLDRKIGLLINAPSGDGLQSPPVSIPDQPSEGYLPSPAPDWQGSMGGWSRQSLPVDTAYGNAQTYTPVPSAYPPPSQTPIHSSSPQMPLPQNNSTIAPAVSSFQYTGYPAQPQTYQPPQVTSQLLQPQSYDSILPVLPAGPHHAPNAHPPPQTELPNRHQSFHNAALSSQPGRALYAPEGTHSVPAANGQTSHPAPSPSTHVPHDHEPSSASPMPPINQGSSSSRPLVRPPGDVECCRSCGLRESPEWRRSESGVKDLCNACGLRLARQVAKREGRQRPRKKKERSA